MSHHSRRSPLRLQPRPSRRLAVFLVLVHVAVAAVALALPVGWPVRAGLLLAAAGGLVHGLAAHVLRWLPWSIAEALWSADGTWILVLASGREVEARLLPSSYVTRALVVLNFRRETWRQGTLVLTADSLDPELLRRLRSRLRQTVPKDVSAPDGSGMIR